MKVTNVIFARRKEPQSTLNNVMASVFHPPHFYTLIVRIFHVIEWWVGATQKGCHKRILWLGLVKVTIHDQMMSIPKWYNQLTSCGSFFFLYLLLFLQALSTFFLLDTYCPTSEFCWEINCIRWRYSTETAHIIMCRM